MSQDSSVPTFGPETLSSFLAGTHLVILTSLIVLCGCSRQEDAVPLSSPVKPQQPKVSLAVQAPADRMNLKPGFRPHKINHGLAALD